MRLAAPRPARAAVVGLSLIVLAAAGWSFLAAGALSDGARALVSSWQLFPGLAKALRGAAEVSGSALSLALPVLLLSALFGRWYCAALCPLGALQDLATLLKGRRGGFRSAGTLPRIGAALCAAALLLAGAAAWASWLDPWSLFGRFLTYDLRPLALLSAGADLWGFDAWTTALSAAAMAGILLLAFLRGRWFCGTLCPVGSLLGLLNRWAPLRIRLDPSSCLSCGACSARCPASCIDETARRIDDSRCLYCLACIGSCPAGAIHYGRARAIAAPAALGRGISRRGFLAALAGGGALLALSSFPLRALGSRPLAPPRPATPPGSRSLSRFLEACTACGLCVSACPSSVLQPSLGQFGLRALLTPRLDYSVSYCQYECRTCLLICPSGALEPLPLEDKKLAKIGDASLVRELCIVFTSKTKCGACAEHCPTGAVRMIEAPTGIPEPLFTSTICIGCGACHHACPVKPIRAITVSGLPLHERALRPTAALLGASETAPAVKTEGFPF